MRDLRSQCSLAASVMMLVAAGCATPRRTASHSTPSAEATRSSTPFLDRGGYPERLGAAMEAVLAKHRFSIPWIAIRGSDASIWFVAERFQSEHRFERIRVCVTGDREVTATITGYQFGPSDWAVLGRLFADFRPEAESIAADLSAKLGNGQRTVR